MRIGNLSDFAEPGLYLLFPDGTRLDLTRKEIETRVRVILDDPEKIPPHVRAAADYEACAICPERNKAEICHAIMPTLCFLDELDRYMSYDVVTAVFCDPESGALRIRETTMQEALQYVSILSLIDYCEVGRSYAPYFEGVDPLMPPPSIARAVFQNMYLACRGDMTRLQRILSTMQDELLHTAECQARRLRVISQRDALINAFVNTQMMTELMVLEVRKMVEEMGNG